MRTIKSGNSKKKIIKNVLNDTVWCIAGLVLMNVVIQFLVYPAWNRRMGSEAYGNVLYLMSILSTLSYSVGAANNLFRMKASVSSKTQNAPYLLILTGSSLLMVPIGIAFGSFGSTNLSAVDTALFVLLLIATTWRYYAEVQYRLTINYRGYFLFYCVISVGYLIGVGAYSLTEIWPIALLFGELGSILLVYWKGNILLWDGRPSGQEFQSVFRPVLVLFLSTLVSNLIYNGDRILLKLVMDGTSVTIYYLASLLGKTVMLISTPFNSVIMGYLARFKGKLTIKIMNFVALVTLALALVAALCCTAASHILIPILYPNDYELAKHFFVMANLSQIFCFTAAIVGVVLLRFAKTKYQVYMNGIYAIVFLLLCIPAAIFYGLQGFCSAIMLTGFVKYATSIFLGYRYVLRQNKIPGEVIDNGTDGTSS